MKLFGKLVLDSISSIDNYSSTGGEKIFNTEIPIKQNNRYSIRDNYITSLRKKNDIHSHLYISNNIDPDRLNLLKTVKTIRESINKNSNNLFHSNIGYDDENFRYVYEAKKQIMNYRKRKAKRISDKYSSLNQFLQDSKHIGINNIIINNLKEENKKLNGLENENKNKIRQGNKDLLENQRAFQKYIKDQKSAYKSIENSLIDISNKSKELLIQKHYEELTKRNIEEEMERILMNLEELRESCAFVTKVVNFDSGKFEKKIIDRNYKSKLSNPNDKPDFNEITLETIKNYNFCLNRNEEEEKELKELLNDPNLMMIKFEEVEDGIIRLLDNIHQMKINKIYEQEDMEKNLKEMNERLIFYEKDFESINNFYKIEEENLKNLIQGNKKKNNYAEDLIKEIFNYLLEFENNNNKKNKSNLQMKDMSKICLKKMNNIENKINNYIFNLEKYELEDIKIFSKAISERREYNKDKKYFEQKRKLEEEREEKGRESVERLKKNILQSKKTERPFRILKKIKHEKIIQEDNNEEYDILFY